MISKLPEPIIDKEKPFKNCKLALAEVSTAKWWLYFGH